jgi:hypothetical protein
MKINEEHLSASPRHCQPNSFPLRLAAVQRMKSPFVALLKVKLGVVAATPLTMLLVGNFGVWLFGLSLANAPYPKTRAGLPFLRGPLIGDWGFMATFVGVAVLASRPQRRAVTATA